MNALFLFVLLVAAPETGLQKEWVAGPGFEPKAGALPDVHIGPSVIMLQNRGLAVSKEKLSNGFVSFRWVTAFDTGTGSTYHTHLCVVLRTDGVRSKEWPFEIDQGVIVRLAPDSLGVETKMTGEGTKQLIPVKDMDLSGERLVTITDKGDRIEVSINGKVILEGKIDPKFGGENRKMAIYNREGVANSLHVDILRGVEAK